MKKSKCYFCEKEKPIRNAGDDNPYCFTLTSQTLVITDRKNGREYLYGVMHCPICGKKLVSIQ